MAVTGEALVKHPGLNPKYMEGVRARLDAQVHNRKARILGSMIGAIPVPKQPNKYVPHYGAKEAARYAGRISL